MLKFRVVKTNKLNILKIGNDLIHARRNIL